MRNLVRFRFALKTRSFQIEEERNMIVCTSKNIWVDIVACTLISVIMFYITQRYVLMAGTPLLLIVNILSKNYRKGLIINKISKENIKSFFFGKPLCTLCFEKDVYYRCFREEIYPCEKGKYFIILSNSPISEYCQHGHLYDHNPQKEIILPDTERVWLALKESTDIGQWILQGNVAQKKS